MNNVYRKQFSFFNESRRDVYLDSAATTQKLDTVLACTDTFARDENASVHRSAYPLANQATAYFEGARNAVAELINAHSSAEIVFTSGATESINMVGQGLCAKMLKGNTILLCESEHHANILPWQHLAKRLGLMIKVLPLASNGGFNDQTQHQWLEALNEDVAIVACAHVSNVLGNIYPIQVLCEKARQVKALSIIDGTQAIAHLPVDVQSLNCDFYVFSGHKMYAPTGIGVCWGRYTLLEALSPSKLGGEMVTEVSFSGFTCQPPPLKFEAGTPNIIGALGLHQASRFLINNIATLEGYEHQLYDYLYQKLDDITDIKLLGNQHQSIPIISFYATSKDNHALALQLYQQGIALRFGQHCAMPLMKSLGLTACLRVSLACYNNHADIDTFIEALKIALNDAAMSELDDVAPVSNTDRFSAWDMKLRDANNWPEKHRQLLLLSKTLPMLDSAQRSTENELRGCEAKVWLLRDSNTLCLKAYSDSKIIRGILAVLLLKHNQLLNEAGYNTALKFDYVTYLTQLGLSSYFSAGRKDGVQAVVSQMRLY